MPPAWISFLILSITLLATGCGSIYTTRSSYLADSPGEVFIMPYYTKVASGIEVKIQSQSPKDDGTQQSMSETDSTTTKEWKHKTLTTTTESQTTTTATKPKATSITLSTVNLPEQKGFLYFRKSAFYNSSVEFATGIKGLVTKSDTNSTQQVTAILSEIGQTVGQALAGGIRALGGALAGLAEKKSADVRKRCTEDLATLAPFDQRYFLGDAPPFVNTNDQIPLPFPIDHALKDPKVTEWETTAFEIKPAPGEEPSKTRDTVFTMWLTTSKDAAVNPDSDVPIAVRDHVRGFYAYEPSSMVIYVTCHLKGILLSLFLTEPTVVPMYRFRHVEDPQRNFWTSPQDSYTLADGVVVGHKYSEQSPIKAVVDLLTSPLRAVMPSTQTTHTSTVQVGGTSQINTHTTTTTVSPPK